MRKKTADTCISSKQLSLVCVHYFLRAQAHCDSWHHDCHCSPLSSYLTIFYSQMLHRSHMCLRGESPITVRVGTVGAWMSFGGSTWVCVCVCGGRRTDKCWGQRLRQACPLEGRRSSWAECIYRAAFLRIGLLSNWAPVAPRHPHPPVVGDLCGGAAALRSRLRLLSLFNQSAARKYIFEVLVLQIHVSLLF